MMSTQQMKGNSKMKRLFNVFVIVIAIAVLTSALSISAFAAENEFTITDVNEKTISKQRIAETSFFIVFI